MSEDIVKQSEEIVKENEEISRPEETVSQSTDEASPASADVIISAKKTDSLSNDEKTMGMLAHLLAIFTSFIGPLVIWLTQKDQSKFAETEGKEALNFQISLVIYYTVLTVITTVLSFITLGLFSIVGSLLYFGLYVFSLVVMIMGTVSAKDGKNYQYPLCIRFIQ